MFLLRGSSFNWEEWSLFIIFSGLKCICGWFLLLYFIWGDFIMKKRKKSVLIFNINFDNSNSLSLTAH